MLIHPKYSDLHLFGISDVTHREESAADKKTDTQHLDSTDQYAAERKTAAQIFEWARSYLAKPHPALGRPGSVCPYVPSSLQNGLFFVAVKAGTRHDLDQVADAVLRYRDWFLEMEPCNGHDAQFKTFLIVFSDVSTDDAPEIIDVTQKRLKPDFVNAGLMIGEFHPRPPSSTGLWNPSFRPLKSPLPLIAIRHMVAADLPFLTSERRYFDAYNAHFGHAIPPILRELWEKTRSIFQHEASAS